MSFDENVQPDINTGGDPDGLYLAMINIINGKNINSNDTQKIVFIDFCPNLNYLSIMIYTVLELKKEGLWIYCFIRQLMNSSVIGFLASFAFPETNIDLKFVM